jgi:hypothetical protein
MKMSKNYHLVFFILISFSILIYSEHNIVKYLLSASKELNQISEIGYKTFEKTSNSYEKFMKNVIHQKNFKYEEESIKYEEEKKHITLTKEIDIKNIKNECYHGRYVKYNNTNGVKINFYLGN